MTETAFLIWELRCERRVGRQDDPAWVLSNPEVSARWYAALNKRLLVDRTLARREFFGSKSLSPRLVLDTWHGLIQNESLLPDSWIRSPRVLVGIAGPT